MQTIKRSKCWYVSKQLLLGFSVCSDETVRLHRNAVAAAAAASTQIIESKSRNFAQKMGKNEESIKDNVWLSLSVDSTITTWFKLLEWPGHYSKQPMAVIKLKKQFSVCWLSFYNKLTTSTTQKRDGKRFQLIYECCVIFRWFKVVRIIINERNCELIGFDLRCIRFAMTVQVVLEIVYCGINWCFLFIWRNIWFQNFYF